MNQAVQLVILIGVRTCSSQLRLVEFCQTLWTGGVGDAEDVIYGIIAVLVLHQRITASRKRHVLHPLALLVVSIGGLRAVSELLIDGMSVLVVAYLCHDGTLLALLAACQTLHLSGTVVVVGDDLTVGIGHRVYTVPAVVGSTIDVGADVRHARHDGAHSLGDLTLSAIVVGLSARVILHEGKPSGTVILVTRLSVGVGDPVEEVLGIEYLVEPLIVVGVGDAALLGDALSELCRELGKEVARRVVGHVGLSRVGMAHHQLAAKQVVFISGLPAVGVRHGRHLIHGIVGIPHGDVLTAGMLHHLSVAAFLIGVALCRSAEGIRHLRLQHRNAVVAADGVCTPCGAAVGKGHLGGTVVGVVFGLGLQVARGVVVGADVAVALRRGIVDGDVSAEGIEHGTSADDAHLGRAAAVPYHARLLGLDGTHEGVGKGVGVDVAVLRVVDGMRLALLGEVLELDSKGLAALYLVGRTHGGLSAQCVVGVLHPLAVEVGGHLRSIPKWVIFCCGAVAVGIADLRHETVIEVVIGIGVEHTLTLVVLRLGQPSDVAVAVVCHVVDGRLVAVVERNLRDLAVAVHLRAALTVGSAAAADSDMARYADDVLVRQLIVVNLGIELLPGRCLLVGNKVTKIIIGVLHLRGQAVATRLVEVRLDDLGQGREEHLHIVVVVAYSTCTSGRILYLHHLISIGGSLQFPAAPVIEALIRHKVMKVVIPIVGIGVHRITIYLMVSFLRVYLPCRHLAEAVEVMLAAVTVSSLVGELVARTCGTVLLIAAGGLHAGHHPAAAGHVKTRLCLRIADMDMAAKGQRHGSQQVGTPGEVAVDNEPAVAVAVDQVGQSVTVYVHQRGYGAVDTLTVRCLDARSDIDSETEWKMDGKGIGRAAVIGNGRP